ncbi:hypothetical protein BaRGS_00005755 [Batillaria attramentaria]|uniref:Uncharacterized protein n=1 Tax=Batillaria attramentaria TaxID=370345 RepID=A0ABD0LU65_9CAEN
MSSAEGLFVQEKKDTSKLKLKIRLTKSGGFVSISGNKEDVSSQETSGSQFNENIHNEQEYFDTLPSHHGLPWTRTQSSTPVLTNKKKVRKKKQKNRQVASDKDIFKESPCGVSEGHRLSSCQSASYPPVPA